VFPAVLSTLLFAISVACGYRSSKIIGGAEANLWRLASGAVCLGVWAYVFGMGLSGSGFPIFLLSGIVGIGLGDFALFQALPRLGARLSSLLIQCCNAPFGAIIEWAWLGTSLNLRQILSILVIIAGVALALAPGQNLHLAKRTKNIGIAFCVLAAFGNAFGAVLTRKAYDVARVYGDAPDGGTAAFQRILGGLLLAAVIVLFLKRQAFRVQKNAPRALVLEASARKWRAAWPWIFVNSLAGQTLGVSCMQWALETTPTGIVLAIMAITPITIIPVSYILEKERPTLHTFAGAAVAVAGVIALTLSR
jgi:drug/metabolite transporter (DMT)-like permease